MAPEAQCSTHVVPIVGCGVYTTALQQINEHIGWCNAVGAPQALRGATLWAGALRGTPGTAVRDRCGMPL